MTLSPVIERLEQNPAYLRENWSLPPDAARFLYLLARIGRFRNVLEVGTSVGYSTLHLAMAASRNEGRVTSIDASPERQAQAATHLQEAGLSDCVTLLEGDALETLARLQADRQVFDLMFLDARKSEYIDYLRCAETLLAPGGVLLADNTRSHREDMLDFIAAVTDTPDWITSDLDTSNGFILARKRD
ncbi:MAG TPA: class I SAM-dependent methyltransferase [Coleofasciculaceae cyanobacterium]|jgi:predicted O-methyltransferase YrrM